MALGALSQVAQVLRLLLSMYDLILLFYTE